MKFTEALMYCYLPKKAGSLNPSHFYPSHFYSAYLKFPLRKPSFKFRLTYYSNPASFPQKPQVYFLHPQITNETLPTVSDHNFFFLPAKMSLPLSTIWKGRGEISQSVNTHTM